MTAVTDTRLSATIQDEAVQASGLSVAEAAARAAAQLARRRICLVRGFPVDADAYLEFLSAFGEPLDNYSSKSNLAKDAPNPKINRVRYKRKAEVSTQSVHYVSGALRPHSARSWRAPRPAYFAMLMVDPGWRDTAAGERGESIVLSWQSMFSQLATREPEIFEPHFGRLCSTPVSFQADNVREEVSDSPLLYQLPDAQDRFDVGVRLKQDMRAKAAAIADTIEDFPAYQQALHYLLDSSDDPQYQAEFAMDAGDLLILDNNRFAHGRRKIVGERLEDGELRTNDRELWSVTVG
ncbi:MAG TPA: TauD/TfdA family dioxygenase [Jatrophihabitans sp.]|nr:TauD/TfdA family dioxygenase [Jatrophihabitans sp.]